MAFDFGTRAKEPEQRGHGGIKRAGHLRDQHPHLAALGKRISVLACVWRDVACARGMVEGAGFDGMIEVEVFSKRWWEKPTAEFLEAIQQAYLQHT